MNQSQLNIAGGCILFVAAVSVVWPAHHLEGNLPQQADLYPEYRVLSPTRSELQASDHPLSVATEASPDLPHVSPAKSAQTNASSQSTLNAFQTLSGQPLLTFEKQRPVHTLAKHYAPSKTFPTSSLATTSSRLPIGTETDQTVSLLPVIIPAALIQMDHPAVVSPQAEKHLGEIANHFTDVLKQSGLDPVSPQYRQLWNQQQILADARFRAMYGGCVWNAHHIQSHHARSNFERK